ncbi:hypothetical protein BYT27DRAFT_7316747, partial [Phlegmacium glaucopus]
QDQTKLGTYCRICPLTFLRCSPSFSNNTFHAASRSQLVMFWPGLAQKPRLWPGFGRLWLSQTLGQAKAPKAGLAQAWLGPGRGF